MGTEACATELMDKENIFSSNSISISKLVADESCGNMSHQRPSMWPMTPDSNRENGEQNHDLSSPLTLVSSTPNASNAPSPTSPYGNNSGTPKETLFDSFAPAPDKFMLAPHRCKYREESRTHVVQWLNFNLGTDVSHESEIETISDEEQLFQIVYGTIMDAIISEASKEVVAKFPNQVSDYSDGFRTPKSAPRLSGIAETCPGAPMKSASKYRNIDTEICRKLEF